MINTVKKLLSFSRITKQVIMVLFDIIILELSIILSYSLRQAAWFWPSAELEKLVYLAPLFAIPVFYFFGLYHSVVRFMGAKALTSIVYAISFYMIIWSLIGYFINVEVPRSVLIYHDGGNIYKVSEYFSGFFVLCIINWLICILLIGSSRMIVRQAYQAINSGFFDNNHKRKNIAIYGAGEAGIQLANALYFSKDFKPVAFIDDNTTLIGKQISELKIFSSLNIKPLIKKFELQEVLIAIPSMSEDQKNKIIDKLKK